MCDRFKLFTSQITTVRRYSVHACEGEVVSTVLGPGWALPVERPVLGALAHCRTVDGSQRLGPLQEGLSRRVAASSSTLVSGMVLTYMQPAMPP